MKKMFFILCAGLASASGCNDVVIETDIFTHWVNEPVFMNTDAFRQSVQITTKARVINNYGKMCFYDGYLYISESEEGIHIIDNTDPSNPQNVGFIELLGNVDLAIRNNKLYADAYIDLVWFDITDPQNPELEGRLENVFDKCLPLPSTGNNYLIDYKMCYDEKGSSKGVVVGWELKERTDISTLRTEFSYRAEKMDAVTSIRMSNGSSSSVGINGSMSRFSLYQDYLYSVINNYMSIFDLSVNPPKKAVDDIPIGFNVETIFSYKEYMFMGTPTGMMIYSVANPLKPEFVRAVWHIFGCDPVVVENDMAYVTIHSGNACGQTNNDLMIYDVSDVSDPKHIVTYAMKNPKGLGIDNTTLFVCDDGLKIFNASNPQTLMANRLAHYAGMDGYDVIPFDNVLMMIADDGLYQYDYSDLTQIRQLSKLPIEKP